LRRYALGTTCLFFFQMQRYRRFIIQCMLNDRELDRQQNSAARRTAIIHNFPRQVPTNLSSHRDTACSAPPSSRNFRRPQSG
jgi:hypothetical protein